MGGGGGVIDIRSQIPEFKSRFADCRSRFIDFISCHFKCRSKLFNYAGVPLEPTLQPTLRL